MTANQILVTNSRKQREFIPDSKKDESYWDRRKRNNEAAKRWVLTFWNFKIITFSLRLCVCVCVCWYAVRPIKILNVKN